MSAAEILSKAVLPTHLSSAEIRAQIASDVRARSFFSARTTERGYLEQIRGIVAEFAAGRVGGGEARRQMIGWLDHFGYDAERGGFPGAQDGEPDAGVLNLGGQRRLDLILQTQQRAAAYAARAKAETPAWRLERWGSRREPRADWPARWAAAGESVGWEGAVRREMAALKNSPVWRALSYGAGGFGDALGNGTPPFAYGSGLGWTDVSAEEAERLGLDVDGVDEALGDIAPSDRELADVRARFGDDFTDELLEELS